MGWTFLNRAVITGGLSSPIRTKGMTSVGTALQTRVLIPLPTASSEHPLHPLPSLFFIGNMQVVGLSMGRNPVTENEAVNSNRKGSGGTITLNAPRRLMLPHLLATGAKLLCRDAKV